MTEKRPADSVPSRGDLVELTKIRLSALVVVTTGAGFLLAWPKDLPFDWWRFVHTVFGTLLAACGAAVFNQLMEIEPDARMRRTADRPLPAGRMAAAGAFVVGWVLSAFGIVHLAVKVNFPAALLAGVTLFIYIFIYTPLKRRSSWNTAVGGVAGAIPPVIGWAGAGGGFDAGAWWLFALLFFWQMPHFFAINWVHREEYSRAGFVMLANKDESGKKTAFWSLLFAVGLVVLGVAAPALGLSHWWFAAPGVLLSAVLVWQAFQFLRGPDKAKARKMFFGTLIYLPVVLAVLLMAKG